MTSAWVLYWCGSEAFQGGDPLRMSWIAAHVSRTPSGIAPIDASDRAWLVRSGRSGHRDSLNRYLAARGWVFDDQMGAVRTYRTPRGKVSVYCRMYTAHFQLCRVREPR